MTGAFITGINCGGRRRKTGLFSLDAGYRYMAIDLENNENGSNTETEISLSGPVIGFVFEF